MALVLRDELKLRYLMSDPPVHFMIIDDDPVNNLICRKIIGNTLPETTISVFTDPETALGYIESRYKEEDALVDCAAA